MAKDSTPAAKQLYVSSRVSEKYGDLATKPIMEAFKDPNYKQMNEDVTRWMEEAETPSYHKTQELRDQLAQVHSRTCMNDAFLRSV